MRKIAIIGAGITGLTAAFSLKRQGFDVILFEERDHTGGVIQSRREEGFLVESGPHSLMEKGREITALIDDLNLGSERVYPTALARRRYIVKGGELVALPASPASIIGTRLFSTRGKCRVLLEPFIPRRPSQEEEETLASFVERRLGAELLDYAVNPFVGGIFAGDPGSLSVEHAFPTLHQWERDHGSIFRGAIKQRKKKEPGAVRPRLFSFKNGLGTLTRALTSALGDAVLLNSKVDNFSRNGSWKIDWHTGGEEFSKRFDSVLIAAPAYKIPGLAGMTDGGALLDPLHTLPYAPISLLTLGYQREDVGHPLDGFGALVPEKEGLPLLGISFSSSTFPNRAPAGCVSLTVYIGGARQPDLAGLPPDAQLAQVLPSLKKLLGITGEPVFMKHQLVARAIPQYNLGHGEYLNLLAAFEQSNPGLYLAGNYRCGISIGDCIQAGIKAAARIAVER